MRRRSTSRPRKLFAVVPRFRRSAMSPRIAFFAAAGTSGFSNAFRSSRLES
jgi:hypothetical protein